MTKTSSSQELPQSSELVPERIAQLLGEPPILPFEDAEQFEALHAEFLVAYDPKDMVERVWVRDLAETRWELMRLRKMRRAAIENSLPAAAAQLVPKQLLQAWGEPEDSTIDVERVATKILRKAARGNKDYRETFSSIVNVGGVTYHMLEVVAYAKALKTISALDGSISMELHRFDQIVRNLENRRKTNNTMIRSLGGVPGDVVDVDVPNGDGNEEAFS